jgi:hypothetical protein
MFHLLGGGLALVTSRKEVDPTQIVGVGRRTHRWGARCRDTPGQAKSVSQVLSYVVDRVATGNTSDIVRDANGGTVGEWSLD